jgi:hypothetical protein
MNDETPAPHGGSTMNRRRATAAIAALIAGIAAAISVPFARRERSRRLHQEHHKGPPDHSPVDAAVVERVALFSGALCGHRLRDQALHDLSQSVEFMAQADSGWRPDFVQLAAYVDRRARALGAAGFKAADDDVRERIVDEIMRTQTDSRRSAFLALVSADERMRRFARGSVVDKLARAYRTSGAAWRRRGYTRWPGVAGDPREYTREGPAYRC